MTEKQVNLIRLLQMLTFDEAHGSRRLRIEISSMARFVVIHFHSMTESVLVVNWNPLGGQFIFVHDLFNDSEACK